MKNKSFLLVLTLLLLVTVSPLAAFAPVGTVVGQFMEIGMGAKGAGMGEAYTTVASGAEAIFWNPAGVVDGGKNQLFLSQTQWPADMAFGGAALSMTLGNVGTFAISSIYLMTDDMEITSLDDPSGTGEYFSLSNYTLGLTYGRYLTDRVSIGVTGKLVREEYMDHNYSAWSLDLGSIYRTNFHGLRLGMSIMNFGPEVRFSGEYIDYSDQHSYLPDPQVPKKFQTYSLPVMFRFGTSINLLEKVNYRLTLAGDMIHPNNNVEQYNLGIEYSFRDMASLRGGYKFAADEGGLTVGAGIRIPVKGWTTLCIDYAYSDLGMLTNSHRFSLGLSF
ncbi:MAG: PorV/PorQ family protein [Candidatus Marinimicrobia bacterium]|nr:PorV/PorQ family protein [Candidatus Neomarinimicrobiota bacterium]MDD5582262.1 PorV/PorQ family protein [Candidatus Neomarinimicrobiota bacterium]